MKDQNTSADQQAELARQQQMAQQQMMQMQRQQMRMYYAQQINSCIQNIDPMTVIKAAANQGIQFVLSQDERYSLNTFLGRILSDRGKLDVDVWEQITMALFEACQYTTRMNIQNAGMMPQQMGGMMGMGMPMNGMMGMQQPMMGGMMGMGMQPAPAAKNPDGTPIDDAEKRIAYYRNYINANLMAVDPIIFLQFAINHGVEIAGTDELTMGLRVAIGNATCRMNDMQFQVILSIVFSLYQQSCVQNQQKAGPTGQQAQMAQQQMMGGMGMMGMGMPMNGMGMPMNGMMGMQQPMMGGMGMQPQMGMGMMGGMGMPGMNMSGMGAANGATALY